MADCTRCGRKLPALSFGSGLCTYCRQAEQDEIQPGGHASQLIPAWRTGPSVTMAIMAINAAVFLVMFLKGVALNPSGEDLFYWGGDLAQYTFGGEPWRALTSVFVHGGLFHIATNMWCLWNIGRLAEQIYDKKTYAVAYLLCGFGGSVASLWATPDTVCVGASGAVFGIAGLLITTFWMGNLPIPREQTNATMSSLVAFAIFNLVLGAARPGISNSAHIGGLFTGLLLGGMIAPRLTHDPRESRGVRWLILGGVTVVLVGMFQLVKDRFLAGS